MTAILLGTSGLAGPFIIAAPAFAQETRSYDIPAAALADVLNRYAREAGVELAYKAGLTAGVSSTGLKGSYGSAEALSHILSGTGLTFRKTGDRAFTIEPAPQASSGAVQLGTLRVQDVNGTAGHGGAGGEKGAVQRPSDKPYRTPGSNAYISQEAIARVPVISTGDLLKTTSGVISSGNRNGDSIDVNIRGMQGYNRVNMMVDGAPSESSDYRGYNGSRSRMSVDPAFVGGIEIEKGPSGGPSGSGYSAGSVNATTIEPSDIVLPGHKFGLRMQVTLGDNAASPPPALTGVNAYSYGLTPDQWHAQYPGSTNRPGFLSKNNFQGNVALAMQGDHIDLLAAYSRVAVGNYYSGKNGNGYDKTHINSYNGEESYDDVSIAPGYEVYDTSRYSDSVLLKAGLKAGDHTLKLSYMYYGSTFGEYDGETLMGLADPDYPIIPTELPPRTIKTHTATMKYRFDPESDLIDLHADFWFVHKREQFWNEEKPGAMSDDVLARYFRETRYGGEIFNNTRLEGALGTWSSRYGVSYSAERAKNDEDECDSTRWSETADNPYCYDRITFYNPQGKRETFSAYLQNTYQPLDWLKLDGDVRYDGYAIKAVDRDNDRDGSRVNAKGAITVEPLQGVQVFAQQARGWRPPSLREMTMNFNVMANPNLKAELANNTEFGVNVLKDSLFGHKAGLRIKVAYFINDTENYVIRTKPADTPNTWGNIDKAKHRGWEANLEFDTGFAFGQAAFTRYDKIEYCMADTGCVADVNRTPSGVPTDYQANYIPPKYNGSATVGVRFLSDRRMTVGGRVDFNGKIALAIGENGARQTKAQAIYNAFATLKYSENISVNVSAENIFDDYYYDPMIVGSIPSPGRTFKTTLTTRF